MNNIYISQLDNHVKLFINRITAIHSIVPLKYTMKALDLLINNMNKEKGLTRHNGSDYFTHPIELANIALDFDVIQKRIRDNNIQDADYLLSSLLLHDILEDCPWITKEYFINTFNQDIYKIVDNVSKRKDESTEKYLNRVCQHKLSIIVKVTDRLHNIMTMGNSTKQHRLKQYKETIETYIPFIKLARDVCWEDKSFIWQAKIIIETILIEVGREVNETK